MSTLQGKVGIRVIGLPCLHPLILQRKLLQRLLLGRKQWLQCIRLEGCRWDQMELWLETQGRIPNPFSGLLIPSVVTQQKPDFKTQILTK